MSNLLFRFCIGRSLIGCTKRGTVLAMARFILGVASLIFPAPLWAAGIPAFPGAEGFGASTVGGRGGRVIEVTNLNDDGPGSFRAAVEASGARIVVFRVGGTITLTRGLEIANGALTIAGQTAPGGGITIRTQGTISLGGESQVSDVVIRYVRFRFDQSGGVQNNDIVTINGSNMVIDHCTFSWGTDSTLSTGIGSHDITIQWCIIAEGLTKGSEFSEGSYSLSLHHNLWAHHFERLPKMRGENAFLNGNIPLFDFRNNVIYNWGSYATGVAGSARPNVVNNFYKAGVNSSNPQTTAEIVRMQGEPGRAIYVSGNFGPSCAAFDCSDQWNSIISDTGGVRGENTAVFTPHVVPPVATATAQAAYDQVLAGAGASLFRDSADQRIIDDVRNGSGRILGDGTGSISSGFNPAVVFGWPNIPNGTAPIDSDHDGMPDSWETLHGFNLNNASDSSLDADGDGYHNIEEFLNGTNPTSGTPVTDVTPPTLSGITTTGITASGATITWGSNEPSDTQVEYGPTTGYGQSTNLNSSPVTAHSAILTNLSAGTLYHYRVKSRDSAGNLATSTDSVFTTVASGDSQSPILSAISAAQISTSGSTVSWTTNEPSDTQVEYGLTTGYGQSTNVNTTPVTAHSAVLTNLVPGTLYHYRVKSRDAAGNLATSGDSQFTTISAGDNQPPTLSAITSTGTTVSTSTITWTTSEPSDTQVEYGLTTGYGQSTSINATPVTAHAALLTNLVPGTLYHYRVKSRDAAGNLAISGDSVFTTISVEDDQEPTLSGITVTGITASTSTISWTTNEPADTQVDYGLTNGYGQSTSPNASQVTAHSASLGNLLSNTLYHYRVRSRDAAGNLAASIDYTFVTQPNPDSETSLAITALSPSLSPVESQVVISGRGFRSIQGTSSVTLAGRLVACSSWSDTSITFVVPSDATSGLVVVAVAGVQSNGVRLHVKLRSPKRPRLS